MVTAISSESSPEAGAGRAIDLEERRKEEEEEEGDGSC